MALIAACSLVLNCGGGSSGPLTLAVKPSVAAINTDVQTGQIQLVTLQAVLSSGQSPTDVQWSTSNSYVGVGGIETGNPTTTDVGCNIQGLPGWVITATITATAQGLTGTASVTCTWD
ncbi:MAG: hypothetical protein ACLQLC_17830 [Candidatus Sulfotelmatobacter sp.]